MFTQVLPYDMWFPSKSSLLLLFFLDIHQILMCNQAQGKENETLSFNLISMHEIITLAKGKCNNFLTKEKWGYDTIILKIIYAPPPKKNIVDIAELDWFVSSLAPR